VVPVSGVSAAPGVSLRRFTGRMSTVLIVAFVYRVLFMRGASAYLSR
jgi:hypothetical protein